MIAPFARVSPGELKKKQLGVEAERGAADDNAHSPTTGNYVATP
jgi:hypothetical protein